VLVRHAEREHLGHERPDLTRRQVHDSEHQPPREFVGSVACGQLRRRSAHPDTGPEVDRQLERGLTGLGKRLGADNAADTDIYAFEHRERDHPGMVTDTAARAQEAAGTGAAGRDSMARGGAATRTWIGCSGWEYKHWRGDFYPADLPRTRWFERYAAVFDTVEINNTFYRLPEESTFAAWAARAPAGFIYAVKASRFLTHMKKLKDPEEPLDRLFSRMRPLGRHLGPVLYQLPPGWKLDRARLEQFLQVLPVGARHVLEFRDPTWYADDVLAMLERYGVSLCLHDMPGSATGRHRVGPIVYARFHGASGQYSGAYSTARLDSWAAWLQDARNSGADVYAYFNNDVGGHAPRNALTLRRLMEESDG
jgi:uncharacterized protein YecE (DUF72 family)